MSTPKVLRENWKQWNCCFAIISFTVWIGITSPLQAEEIICPPNLPPLPSSDYAETYRYTPFKAGEKSKYDVTYSGVFAGHVEMAVKEPVEHKGSWYQKFYIQAKSGSWYEAIAKVKDMAEAVSHPADFRIAKFYLEEDSQQLFSSRFRQKKWLEFDHVQCRAHERRKKNGKTKNKSFGLAYGAKDAFGVLFYLRTLEFQIDSIEETTVFSSGKNWTLTAHPVAEERLTTDAGTFLTTKLKLNTFFGRKLAQSGDVLIWIAKEGSRPIVAIEAEVAIGSIMLELSQFRPGRS